MPSAQVINFGEDPYANAMGGFAKSFLGELDKRSSKRRNDEVFEQIKSKYGKDAPIEDILRDIVTSEGLDQDYKTDTIKNIKEFATLAAKKDKNNIDAIKLGIRKKEHEERIRTNDIAEDRVKNEKNRIKNLGDKNSRNLSKDISTYNSKFLKDAGVEMSENDRSDMNYFTEDLMSQGKTLAEASRDANQLVQMRRELIDNVKVTPRPRWFDGAAPDSAPEILPAMEQAFNDLSKLYEEDGIDHQTDLKAILKRAGWKDEEIIKILQRVFQSQGRKLRVPKKSEVTEDSEYENADEFFGV
jgi:hypothetical protein